MSNTHAYISENIAKGFLLHSIRDTNSFTCTNQSKNNFTWDRDIYLLIQTKY